MLIRSAEFLRRNHRGSSLVVVFCLILLWHDPLVFWNDDYELSILPVFADVARSWNEGQWPLLSPYSWVCSNLAGEFQYGTFSVFVNAAVVLIWKFPLTFSAAGGCAFDRSSRCSGGRRISCSGAARRLSPALSILVATRRARSTAGSSAGARPIGSARSGHLPGCRGRGGDGTRARSGDEPNGDFSGRRLSFISS